jgi:4-amino-4-deoxy-L-arabinose transferase-like glycosyltransferase
MKKKLNEIVLSKPFIWLLGVISLAILLRFARFSDLATFGHDNSRDSIVSFKMFSYGEYIYVGPVFSVIWGYMSPIYYYMLYPFYLIFKFSPISAQVASMIANISALVLIIYVSYRFYGKAAAFISSILFGFSIYIIIQGGEGLNPSLMLPFSVLAFYSYIEWLKSGKEGISKNKFLYLFSFSLSFMTALHPAGFFTLIPFAILYFVYHPKLSIKSFAISSAIYGILGVLPYLIQEKKLAWWTIKQFINYLKSEDGEEIGFFTSISNYFIAVLKNISLTLFNNTNQIGMIISSLVLGFIIYEAIVFLRQKNNSTVLAFTLSVYLLVFGFLVKFDSPDPHRKWFVAVFVPLLVLYMASLLARLYRTNYWYSTLLILAGIFILNLQQFFVVNREVDSYSYVKEISEIIRMDSGGEDIDIYGANPEPFFYMLWYYENNPDIKDKYFTWIKWAKEKDADMVYFIETEYELEHNKIEEIKSKHDVEDSSLIFTSETGKSVYVFR